MSSYLTGTTMQREKSQIWFLQTITNVATTQRSRKKRNSPVMSCAFLAVTPQSVWTVIWKWSGPGYLVIKLT